MKSAKKKYEKEKKDLAEYIQMQDQIYKKREAQWQAEYNKVYKAYNELEKESIERDYEEFKAPDANGDDMITRAEFNTYVRKYLSSFPELSEKDFPVFEEFDLDGDGIVSFDEWQRFLQLQKQKEAKEAQAGKSKGQYQDLLNALYDQSSGSNSFQNLNKRIEDDYRGKRGTRGR
jgi:Ca2+-binding EF-hand superfamily protein